MAKKALEEYDSLLATILNIYDEPLQPCRQSGMKNGSWDRSGKCSELGGGVHQICVNGIATNTPGFSRATGQSGWSDQRGDSNHCVCLGAWSLYAATQPLDHRRRILKCDAIPRLALSKEYVGRFVNGWSRWNDLEQPDQIVDGVENLMRFCYRKRDPKSERLRSNYCEFARVARVLQKGSGYKQWCT